MGKNMKQVYVFICCLLVGTLISNTVYAKTLKKGTNSIGGRSSYFSHRDTTTENGNETSSTGFGISLGYLMSTNLEIGSGFAYRTTKYGNNTSKSYSIEPFITKHISISNNNNLTLSGQLGYHKNQNSPGNDASQKHWQLSVGWLHFFDNNIAGHFTFNHKETFDADGDLVEYESDYVDVGLKIYF